ncbi:DUF975 family protein [Haloplasma contractile]|uniref:Integral membrane protein n=1 Tax=Haloplasma contractile SSD-17B TaxID=1033810 RepID=F7PVL1_9MOLU|nr:DUF975 family protein [Haloplasma contractile]ERJ12823.1 integral membrane protein [Haloplasma contractile SSD-17B]
MNFEVIKQETKDALVGNRMMLFLVLFVNMLIVGALSQIGIGILIEPVFMGGTFLVCTVILKERKVDFNLLFHYFKDLNHAAKLLAVYLLNLLIVFAGLLLFIIPGIIFSYQYSQAVYVMADNPEMKVWEAMKKSKELMVGHKLELFVFYLSFIGHVLLIIITFGLYAIYAVPYIKAACVNYYLHLTNQHIENLALENEEQMLLDERF